MYMYIYIYVCPTLAAEIPTVDACILTAGAKKKMNSIVCMYIHYAYTYIYMCEYVYMCTYVCIYMYTYIYAAH